ncbi:unnamed protein product [Lampetra fluviatilis]
MIAVWTRGRGRGESDSGVPASGVNFAFSAGLINNDDEQWRLVCAEGRARRRGRRGAERGRRGAERGRRAGAGATEPERDRGRDAVPVTDKERHRESMLRACARATYSGFCERTFQTHDAASRAQNAELDFRRLHPRRIRSQ